MTRGQGTVTIWESIEKVGTNVTTAIVVSVGGGIMWVIRTLLTNRRQIEMLQREMEHRDRNRAEDRETLGVVRDAVVRLESHVMKGGGK